MELVVFAHPLAVTDGPPAGVLAHVRVLPSEPLPVVLQLPDVRFHVIGPALAEPAPSMAMATTAETENRMDMA